MSDLPGGLSRGESLELSDEQTVVQVRKVETHNGVRLEILAPGSGCRIRLCPLELETLTWQTHQTLAELGRPSGAGAALEQLPDDLPDPVPGGAAVELASEYAVVRVRGVQASAHERLEIVATRLGRGIRLAPHELDTLTRQTHETFSEFLQTPFGPESEPEL